MDISGIMNPITEGLIKAWGLIAQSNAPKEPKRRKYHREKGEVVVHTYRHRGDVKHVQTWRHHPLDTSRYTGQDLRAIARNWSRRPKEEARAARRRLNAHVLSQAAE